MTARRPTRSAPYPDPLPAPRREGDGTRPRRLAALALLGVLAVVGCARARRAGDSRWIAEAEHRHAVADQELQGGNVRAARDALRGLVDAPAPGDVPAPDRRSILQDTYFRLAEIDLGARNPRAALASAERGLALGRADDLFVANLLVVRGAAHEALDDGAAAAADYHEALVINDKLLADSLRGGAGAAPRAPEAQP